MILTVWGGMDKNGGQGLATLVSTFVTYLTPHTFKPTKEVSYEIMLGQYREYKTYKEG